MPEAGALIALMLAPGRSLWRSEVGADDFPDAVTDGDGGSKFGAQIAAVLLAKGSVQMMGQYSA